MSGWNLRVRSITRTLADRNRRPPVVLAAAAAVAVLPQFAAGTPALAAHTGAATAATAGAAGAGSYVLTATSTGGSYAPTFTGNGYLGVRVPPAGQLITADFTYRFRVRLDGPLCRGKSREGR